MDAQKEGSDRFHLLQTGALASLISLPIWILLGWVIIR